MRRIVALAAGRRDCGAAEGRRPDDLRPRDRGDRGLPSGRHRGRDRPRDFSRAGRGGFARLLADRAEACAARPVRHRPWRRRQAAADIDWARDRRSASRPPCSTCRAGRSANSFAKALAKGLAPATPAVAIASATLPERDHVAGHDRRDRARSPRPCPPARRSPSSSAGSPAGSSRLSQSPASAGALHDECATADFKRAPPHPSPAARGGEHPDLARGRRRDRAAGDALFGRQGQRGDAAPRAQGLLSRAAAFPVAPRRHDLEVPRHVRASRQGRARARDGAASSTATRRPSGSASTRSTMARSTPTCGRPKG